MSQPRMRIASRNRKVPLLAIDADIQRTQSLVAIDHTLNGTYEDAVSEVEVQGNAYLRAIQMMTQYSCTAANDYVQAEVSRSGNNQIAVNNNTDSLAILSQKTCGTFAQGMASEGSGIFIPMKMFFRKGDKIYLNLAGTNNLHCWVWAILFWEDAEDILLNQANIG